MAPQKQQLSELGERLVCNRSKLGAAWSVQKHRLAPGAHIGVARRRAGQGLDGPGRREP